MTIRVYTSGVFDLFHAGHLHALEMAKEHGDVLIVGVLSDADALSYKRQPIIPFKERLQIVRNIKLIDQVIMGPKFETLDFYSAHNIDVHCQGDQLDGFYVTAKKLGILRILGRSPITETSKIIEHIFNTTTG